MAKYAIRIVSSDRSSINFDYRLFAVAKDFSYVTHLRNLAKESIPTGSSDWVSVRFWWYQRMYEGELHIH